MINNLIKLANHLDSIGLRKEADRIDKLLKEANPLVLGAAFVMGVISLCTTSGCKPIPEEEAESIWNSLDFEFVYDEPPEDAITESLWEPWAIDVNPVCEGGLGDHSCATKEKTDTDITISWPCKRYRFERDLEYYPAGTTDAYIVRVQWKLYRDVI